MNITDLLEERPCDAVRLYLAERDSDLGVPTRILSPVLMLALPETPRDCFDRLNGKR